MGHNSISLAVFPLAPVDSYSVPLSSLEHIELPAKLIDYFLRSNKSDINQFPTPSSTCSRKCCPWGSMCERHHSCCLHVSAEVGIYVCVHSTHPKVTKNNWNSSLSRVSSSFSQNQSPTLFSSQYSQLEPPVQPPAPPITYPHHYLPQPWSEQSKLESKRKRVHCITMGLHTLDQYPFLDGTSNRSF